MKRKWGEKRELFSTNTLSDMGSMHMLYIFEYSTLVT